MKIGIIGASLAGLTAGKKLALGGHEVTVIEKERRPGGKLASREIGGITADYGISHFEIGDSGFRRYTDELKEQNLLAHWAESFSFHDGTGLHDTDPNRPDSEYFAATRGMDPIVEQFTRWVDIKSEVRAGGMTYIGADRTKKRAWMINLTDISVFECDAVIVATQAVEALGILQSAQDETAARRIIRHVDEIRYDPCYSLLASFDRQPPEWKGINCNRSDLRWIGNESSKRGETGRTVLLIRSAPEFTRRHIDADPHTVADRMLERAGEITGLDLQQPGETMLHFWKYFEAVNPIREYFMELEMEGAPFALVGDYFMGPSFENAYSSGERLADYWSDKYSSE